MKLGARRPLSPVVAYPESRMREMKLYVLDWERIDPQRSAILEVQQWL